MQIECILLNISVSYPGHITISHMSIITINHMSISDIKPPLGADYQLNISSSRGNMGIVQSLPWLTESRYSPVPLRACPLLDAYIQFNASQHAFSRNKWPQSAHTDNSDSNEVRYDTRLLSLPVHPLLTPSPRGELHPSRWEHSPGCIRHLFTKRLTTSRFPFPQTLHNPFCPTQSSIIVHKLPYITSLVFRLTLFSCCNTSIRTVTDIHNRLIQARNTRQLCIFFAL